jgi:hypothetical protein
MICGLQVIAQYRREGDTFSSADFWVSVDTQGKPLLWVETFDVRASLEWAQAGGTPVDRLNALDMVRDQVSGRGGEIRLYSPSGQSTIEVVSW